MKVITWNVNGVRAREAQVLALVASEAPDVLCLQEIKAPLAKVPEALRALPGYACLWHGVSAYSGVGLHVRQAAPGPPPAFDHPAFDVETRIATVEVAGVTFATVYVPNGGKDLEAKLRFLRAMDAWAGQAASAGKPLVVCGDLNVALTDLDVHPKERKPGVVGQRDDERALLACIIGRGLVDLGRAADPMNEGLFTWWAPWRNLRQRNIGWRIDYILASEALAARTSSCRVLADFGTSDHAPVLAEIESP
jgi:exodeoxyribonuclease-3